MIVIDTSAVVAILEREPEAERFAALIEADEMPLMSSATFVEVNAVMKHRRGDAAVAIVDRFVELAGIRIEPFSSSQAVVARNAYRRFSSLNFGDTFSYALAKELNVPLLFRGEDFGRTDIIGAV